MSNEGYDAAFVEEPSDLYMCIICHLVLREPVMFVECSHRVCGGCFQQLCQHNNNNSNNNNNINNNIVYCPYDRVVVDPSKVVKDHVTAREVLNFKVCIFVSKPNIEEPTQVYSRLSAFLISIRFISFIITYCLGVSQNFT